MGILQLRDVPDWDDASYEEELARTSTPDDSGPIGRRAQTPGQHTATLIRRNCETLELTYGPELPIEVYRGQERQLPAELSEKLGMRDIRGWLFQVRRDGPNPHPDSFEQLQNKEVLLSKLPHSRNYFLRRTFKPCKHEKAVWRQVARAWDAQANERYVDERLDKVLGNLSVTPFVSFKQCQAAWAVSPMRFDILGRGRFDTEDDYTVAALDIPFTEAMEILSIHNDIERVVELTKSRELFDNYNWARDILGALQNHLRPPGGPIRCEVTDELIERRSEVLEAACWAALCGRELPDAGDSVAKSVVFLYHRFAYNFVGRQPRVRAAAAVAMESANSAVPETVSSIDKRNTSPQEQITGDFRAWWREMGYRAALEVADQLITPVVNADEEQIDNNFTRKVWLALTAWPSNWKPAREHQQALQRLEQLKESAGG